MHRGGARGAVEGAGVVVDGSSLQTVKWGRIALMSAFDLPFFRTQQQPPVPVRSGRVTNSEAKKQKNHNPARMAT